MGLALLKALVSQREPKLAQSGCSSHLSSLLVLTQCPVTEKTLPCSILFRLPLLGVQKLLLLVATFDFIFLFSLCMICMFACTAYLPSRLSVHATYQHKGASTEGRYYVSLYPNCLLYCFFSAWGGVFHVVLVPVGRGIQRGRLLFYKKILKSI